MDSNANGMGLSPLVFIISDFHTNATKFSGGKGSRKSLHFPD
jgi:hypothetical protein